jgi:negative regulator of flagellin synthesis FlgM
MSTIETRSPFFPRSRNAQVEAPKTTPAGGFPDPVQNRSADLVAKTSGDAKVTIPEGVREFSRVKKAVDAAPEMDQSEKIAALKAQIQAGQYQVDYDAVADKMLQSEF